MRTDMECRSLGESRSNYTTDTASSIHQMKQKDTSSKTKKNKKNKGGGGFAAGLLAGAGVGVLAGILLAPERGTATRKKVTESAKKYTDQLTDLTDQATEWAKKQMDKNGGQTDAHVNDAPDLAPTTATGRAFTSTSGTTTGTTGSTGTTGNVQNSPYTDTNKRSDSEVKSMINDPKTPGATGGPSTPTTPPRV